jgi:hypothetical protein
MRNSLVDDQLRVDFSRTFERIQLGYHEIPIGDGIAHAFFLKYQNVDEINDSWRKVSNFIALKCQSRILDDFGKWNTYLFLISGRSLGIDVKYKIENDTFSSRKIVIEDNSSYDDIINKHILNSDLEITIENYREQNPLNKRDFLWALLEGKTLKKLRKTSAADHTFDELLTILKHPNNEV